MFHANDGKVNAISQWFFYLRLMRIYLAGMSSSLNGILLTHHSNWIYLNEMKQKQCAQIKVA